MAFNYMNNLTKKWWFKWLIIGVLIRLILMPITLHPDLWGHSFTAYFFSHEGIFNIYDHLLSLPQSHPLVANFGVGDIFIYPPLTYFTLGMFRFAVKPLTDPNFIPWLMENLGNIHNYKGLYWHLFIFKLPYLFVDLATGFLLASIFKDKHKRKLAFVLWIFNPVTLYATFMMGQLDIIPVFFTVLSLYFASRKKLCWAMVSLGIGGSFKMYPLLLIPIAAFIFGDNTFRKVKYLVVGVLPYVLTIAPFLGSAAFRSMVLLNPKSQKMLFMIWKMSGAEGIYPFILILSLLYFISWYSRKKVSLKYFFLGALLLLFSTTHYHPQWFLWVTPFLVLGLVGNNFKHLLIVLILFFSWVTITLFFEPSLSIGLFNPIWPQLENAVGFSEFLSKWIDVYQIKSVIRSVFAGASIYLVFSKFRLEDRKSVGIN